MGPIRHVYGTVGEGVGRVLRGGRDGRMGVAGDGEEVVRDGKGGISVEVGGEIGEEYTGVVR